MRPELILWDWNGTLLDDVELCVDALNRLLAGFGYPQRYDHERYRAIFGFPIEEYYVRAGFDFTKHSFAELAEKYMEDETGELRDFKVFCFNGTPELVEVDYERFTDHQRNIYSTDWKLAEFSSLYRSNAEIDILKPQNLEEMLTIAAKLSQNMAEVRIDMYSISGRTYIGEITFFHESGFGKISPEEWDGILGAWIELPGKSKGL